MRPRVLSAIWRERKGSDSLRLDKSADWGAVFLKLWKPFRLLKKIIGIA